MCGIVSTRSNVLREKKMKSEEEKQSIKTGAMFQFPMIGLYILTLVLYGHLVQWESWWVYVSHAGGLLFTYCLVQLYVFKGKDTGLIVTGPFRYTRHPMYTGLFLMNLMFWLPYPVSLQPLFLLLQATFILCLIVAAYFQEKETLARFGKVAEEYYERTPRLFLLYPLRTKS